jgi:hypothetical protein
MNPANQAKQTNQVKHMIRKIPSQISLKQRLIESGEPGETDDLKVSLMQMYVFETKME